MKFVYLASSSSSSSSNSTGYSSCSSSSTSSLDSNSTILSAYSSRSNSSLSERSKTSPTPLKQIPIQYLPIINQSNIHLPITTDDEVTQLTSFNENNSSFITSKNKYIQPEQSPLPSTSQIFDTNINKQLTKRRKTITLEVRYFYFHYQNDHFLFSIEKIRNTTFERE
jgi:vesicle coat complex subunit